MADNKRGIKGRKSDGLPPKTRVATAAETLEIDLSSIQVLVDAVKFGTQAAVAKDRDVEPSTVSKQMAWLEWRLGVSLREDPSRKSVRLTKSGDAVVAAVKSFILELSALQRRYSQDHLGPAPTVSIGAPQALAIHYVPYFISEDVCGRIVRDTSHHPIVATFAANVFDCLQYIENGNTDFVICWETEFFQARHSPDEYKTLPLATDYLIPVCGRQFLPKVLAAISPGSHSKKGPAIPFFTYSRGTMLRERVEQIVLATAMTERLVSGHQADTAGTLKHWVKRLEGIAWIPASSLGESTSIARLDVELAKNGEDVGRWTASLPIVMIRQSNRPLRKAAEQFWTDLNDVSVVRPDFKWSPVVKCPP